MVEGIMMRIRFQVFVFSAFVIAGLLEVLRPKPENERLVIVCVLVIALVAIGVFVLDLILKFLRPETREIASRDAAQLKAQAWPDDHQIGIARSFIVFGFALYLGYYFLDQLVLRGDRASVQLPQMLETRVTVSIVIFLAWCVSFTRFFKEHYVTFVTVVILFAGAGVGRMLYIVDKEVHFYYEGFIQVIAFAAFAFRLPPRALSVVCAFMMTMYIAIVGVQTWDGHWFTQIDPKQQAIVVNNLVSLLTFVTLALIASTALRAGVAKSR